VVRTPKQLKTEFEEYVGALWTPPAGNGMSLAVSVRMIRIADEADRFLMAEEREPDGYKFRHWAVRKYGHELTVY
jgi:hypothetical protein